MVSGLEVAKLLLSSQTREFVRNSDYWILPQILDLNDYGVEPEFHVLNNNLVDPLITLPQSDVFPSMQNQRMIFGTHAHK